MNSSNDRSSNADNSHEKPFLLVDGRKTRLELEQFKALLRSESEEEMNTDDRKRVSLDDEQQEAAFSALSVNSRVPQSENEKVQARSLLGLKIIVSTLLGVSALSLGWIALTQIDFQIKQLVTMGGQLTTRGNIKQMQAPENKVVRAVFVKEGEKVGKGQPLVAFDSTNSYEKLQTIETQRQLLGKQNQFYRNLIERPIAMTQVEGAILQLKLPREAAFLARNRTALIAADRQFQAQLQEESPSTQESEQIRVQMSEDSTPTNSNKALANLTIERTQENLKQNQLQLEEAQKNLATAHRELFKIKPLVEEGAISRVEYTERQQAVRFQKAQIERLRLERQSLRATLEQATEQLTKTTVIIRNEAPKPTVDRQKQLLENKKQIAEIDSQLTKIIVENDRQIADLDRQIERVKGASNAFILKAPVAGTISDVHASPGFGSQNEKTLLKLKADDRQLIATVYLPKQELDFVQEGMKATVQIDSYSLSDLGNIEGTVISLGSDALPPDAVRHFYGIPAKIGLDRQALVINQKNIPLRSGMSVTATITVNKKQTLWEIVAQKILNSKE